jgi:chromosome segregation ATPase
MKNTRGVQQEEVTKAADALLASGMRPTIERVRQHLGRGSPNTVSPMLETWFAGLGKRLGMTEETGEEGQMPTAAAQAFAKLWDAALVVARKEAEATLFQDRHVLSTAQAALSEREAGLAHREQVFKQRQDMVDQLLLAEREKTASAEASLVAAQQQLRACDGTVTEFRTAVANAQEQLQAARDHNDAQALRHNEERARWEDRTAGNERRLLTEIERERQAAKEATAAAKAANSQSQATRSDLENRTKALNQKLHVSEIELANTKHALALSELRSTELSERLQEQHAANAAVHEQLNQALAAIARHTAVAKRKATGRKTTAKA